MARSLTRYAHSKQVQEEQEVEVDTVVPVLADHLRSALDGKGFSVGVMASAGQGMPFEFYQASGSKL